MSYSINLAFKQIPKAEVLDFIEKFKAIVNTEEFMDKYIKDNLSYSPPYPYSRYPKGNEAATRDLTDFWIRAMFTYKFIYLDEYQVLACVTPSEKEFEDLFDMFIYCQNSCDQDYEYEYWEKVPAFKAISDPIKNMPAEEFFTKYENEHYCDSMEELMEYMRGSKKLHIDYSKQSVIYKIIYDSIEERIWNNHPKAFKVNCVWDFMEVHRLRRIIEQAVAEREAESKKKDDEFNALPLDEQEAYLARFFTSEKAKEIIDEKRKKLEEQRKKAEEGIE